MVWHLNSAIMPACYAQYFLHVNTMLEIWSFAFSSDQLQFLPLMPLKESSHPLKNPVRAAIA